MKINQHQNQVDVRGLVHADSVMVYSGETVVRVVNIDGKVAVQFIHDWENGTHGPGCDLEIYDGEVIHSPALGIVGPRFREVAE